MENTPPNCHITFYTGEKINTDTRACNVTIKSAKHGDIVINTGENTRDIDLPRELIPLFKHSQDCLTQCLEIEKEAKIGTVYPLVLKNHKANFGTSVGTGSRMGSIHASSIGMTEVKLPDRLSSVFINGVGWCVKSGDSFTILFGDGGRLVVEGKKGVVEWRGVGEGERTYGIERGMPAEVKERLGYLERFLRMF
jgi:hypothetical protein